MEKEFNFEFVNSQTGNVISYLSLLAGLDKMERIKKLEKKKIELATSHQLSLEMIYWQDKDYPIQ